MKKYYLAIDIGASSGRHIIGYMENDRLVTDEVYRFPNGVTEKNGHLIWDIDALFKNVKDGIKAAFSKYESICSLAIDTWGVDYVLLDGENEILPCYAYRDSRTETAIPSVHEKVPFSELYARTGIQFSTFNTIYQLYDDSMRGKLGKASDFLMIPAYLSYKLTGVKFHEYTNATTTGLINTESGDFDMDIIKKLGLPEGLFTTPLIPGSFVGKLKPDIAEYVGGQLSVIACASHDTASAVEGIPIEGDEPYISSGTWSLLGIKVKKAKTDEGSRIANYSNEGGVGYTRYQKNIMGMWVVNNLKKELAPDISFGELTELARSSAFEGTVDVNENKFLAPESMKAAFDSSFDRGKGPVSTGDYIKCALTSLAYGYKSALCDLAKNTDKKPETLYIVGGGAKNIFLNELTEKICGIKVKALPIEATSIGNLKIQMEANMNSFYELAKSKYAEYGIDTEAAMKKLAEIPISLHCWQGDDVIGFDGDKSLSGGIQTTGNYPGRARSFEELKSDLALAFSLMPGKKRLNLHASYAILGDEKADRNEYRPEHFAPWVEFAKEQGLDGIDFNPTMFSHDMMKDGLSLSSPNEKVRSFWVEHCRSCIKIAEYFADEFGTPSLLNIWIPDGYKDVPSDRLSPRMRLKKSLDEILSVNYDRNKVIVAVESKVFGIGVESYTVGNSEFYQNYAAMNGICCLLDNGHYHPTEVVSDKISSMLVFHDKVALHVTRGVRWDSDHVVLLEDELKEIAKEIIRNDAADRVLIGLDYFDASINRISAMVTGFRAMEQALLNALLLPNEKLKTLQTESRFTELMVMQEECKLLPLGAVWAEYLDRQNTERNYYSVIVDYENKYLKGRN